MVVCSVRPTLRSKLDFKPEPLPRVLPEDGGSRHAKKLQRHASCQQPGQRDFGEGRARPSDLELLDRKALNVISASRRVWLYAPQFVPWRCIDMC